MWGILRTLPNIYDVMLFFIEPWHIYDEVFYSEPFVNITYLDFWYIQNLIMFTTQDIRYREYSLHRTLCNIDIFITYIHSSPSILRARGISWAVFYGTLCNTGIFRTRGIFRTLPNIYYEEFYSEPYVTLAFLKPWHIQNPRHIHNTVKHLLWNILFKILCNSDIFRILVYSQLWYIPKSKYIQSSAKYLRWNILLKTLCNYRKFRRPIDLKLSLIQNLSVNYSLMYQLFVRTTNLLLLLYLLFFIKSIIYTLAIDFFSQSLVYELQSS